MPDRDKGGNKNTADAETAAQPAPGAPDDPLIGKTIGGRYHILERLGRGGMGSVYKADHGMLQRSVAVKILHSNLTENAEFMERFRREALIGSMLSHHNAVTLYDFGIEDKSPYLVMQYVEGETLRTLIGREGALSLDRIVRIISQITGALTEAHRLGIIHRDLKPDNIMVTRDSDGVERVSVLDFGIAKPTSGLNNDQAANLTRVDVVMGTPQYMAPEQATNKGVSASSDIYSLGVILYEMLSGEVAYQEYSPVEILLKHMGENPMPIPTIKAAYRVPPRVSEVLAKCLAKSPENRYRSANEFDQALRAAVPGSGSGHSSLLNSRRQIPILGAASLIILLGTYSLARTGMRFTPHPPPKIQLAGLPLHAEETAAPIEAPALPAPEAAAPAAEPVAPTAEPIAAADSRATSKQEEEATQPQLNEPQAQPGGEAVDTNGTAELLNAPEETAPVVEAPEATAPSTVAAAEQPDLIATPESPGQKLSKEQVDQMYAEAHKLFDKKNYATAGIEFKKILAARPDYFPARLSLGVCYLRLGLRDKALEEFETAREQNPNYAPTYYNIATYYAHLGDTPNTIENLEHAIRLFPKIRSWIRDDRDFDNVRDDSKFRKISGEK